MNRFPLWKNILVFVVVFVSAVLSLPNLFGEDEAVQVSRADGVAMDAAALAQATDALKAANVPLFRLQVPVVRVRLEHIFEVDVRPVPDIGQVEVEIYHVFPFDTGFPLSTNVPTRTNSPSDVEIDSATRDSAMETNFV
jgi:hypothetical protein